jgi:hypothetical protein
MKRNENIRETKGNELVEKQTKAVNCGKYERLQRYPAMETKTAETQKIFPDSGKTGNRAGENGNIEQQKSREGARPNNIPIPGNFIVHQIIFYR